MMINLQLRPLSVVLILLVFAYTVQLIRTNRLSAHLAISWVVTEVVFFALFSLDFLFNTVKSLLGKEGSLIAPSLFGLVWLAFLALDSLTRISSLTTKLKEVNQELALTRERLDRIEEKVK
jgi:hypothetical protein